ncbi:HAD family hydrolase [Streptomyces sp. MH13]|uniref:HAD family hydrolase n=1 Tax=unclassified Streptomyces TaxID=2593676 RepID=UPI003CEF1E87
MTDTGFRREATGSQARLLRAVGSARVVLFDFDGPVCDLFGGAATADVAEHVKQAARQHWGTLDPSVEECHDSHGILRPLRDMYERSVPKPSARPLELAEAAVTAREWEAVRTAPPTDRLHTLVGLLLDLGMRLAVVSNNAEEPILAWLGRLGLGPKFDGVFGRSPHDARLMKPHPDCVHRALRHLAVPASDCLLVGDQLTDLEAARSAGTGFLGLTRHAERARRMRQGGADAVVPSYLPVVRAAGELLACG